MNFSSPFIRRPVATFLISLAIMLAGVLAFKYLPVAPLPQIDTPTIVVRGSLSGASPETMAATVATPLERAMGQIAGITELTSRSNQGSSMVIVQFSLKRDINGAARDVQAAINAARTLLPSAMRTLPGYHKANPSDMPILLLALTSENLHPGELYDLATSKLEPIISQIKGVGEVSLFGGALPAVRVEFNPVQLNALGLSLSKVSDIIAKANTNLATGSIGSEGERAIWLQTNGQLDKAKDFSELVVAMKGGKPIQLKDIATVYDSVQNIYSAAYLNNVPSVSIAVTKQTGSNTLETVDAIKAQLPLINELLPSGTKLTLAVDGSTTIRQALYDTMDALLLATILVVVVVFLFLRRGRAAMIPAIALPLSILGTFALMYALGFSLNALTMMALIISTGFVVDDAIVVLENIQRHIDEGLPPFEAALQGSREIGFTVLSMTASLVAVFIPLFLMDNIVGRLFQEFALTLSSALVVSLFISLTLTPMLSAKFLTHSVHVATNPISRGIESLFSKLSCSYDDSLKTVMRHKKATIFALLATILLNGGLYMVVDKGLFPDQDNGLIMGFVRADTTTSFQKMLPAMRSIADRIQSDPGVKYVLASTGSGGFGSRNSASYFISLKDASERKDDSTKIANRLSALGAEFPGLQIFFRSMRDLRAGGRQANAEYQYSIQNDDLTRLREWAPKVHAALEALPELTNVDSDSEKGTLQLRVELDRERAIRYGFDAKSLNAFFTNAFSQREIAPRRDMLNQYYTIVGLDQRYTQNPEVLRNLELVSESGQRVRLSDIATIKFVLAPTSVNHQDQIATTTIAFNLAPGVSLERAQAAIEKAIVSIDLPSSFKTGLKGTAMLFTQIVGQIPWLVALALAVIYILLGILYESWIHPITILSTLPSAGIGALVLMIATGTEFSIIAFIGILLLIGIVKKNGILMVDFARERERIDGIDPETAILEACHKRLRPILMTTFAAFFGALPLVLHAGQNASLNRPLGIAICGGLALSQILTLYTTPVVYVALARSGAKTKRFLSRFIPGMRTSAQVAK